MKLANFKNLDQLQYFQGNLRGNCPIQVIHEKAIIVPRNCAPTVAHAAPMTAVDIRGQRYILPAKLMEPISRPSNIGDRESLTEKRAAKHTFVR